MTPALVRLLDELERFGRQNDEALPDRDRRMLNITRDTGEFLGVLVRIRRAQRVLEVGTSNGYSTLWLADAVREIGGTVTTVELSESKVALAAANFDRSGLAEVITQVKGDAGPFLAGAGAESFELIFLDAERSEYAHWWPEIRRVLGFGGVLVVDNATSHSTQLAPLTALVGADAGFRSCLVPVGNGELLAIRALASPEARHEGRALETRPRRPKQGAPPRSFSAGRRKTRQRRRDAR